MTTRQALPLCLSLWVAAAAAAQPDARRDAGPGAPPDAPQRQRPDPVGDNLIRAELLLRNHADVGLSDAQRAAVRAESQRAQAAFAGLERALRREVAALGELLQQDRPDEPAVTAQLDRVLAAEREIKRAQIAMTLAIKKVLTPEQQARARDLRRRPPGELPGEAARARLQQAQDRARRAEAAGRDVPAARALLRQAEPLVRDGDAAAAAAVLDRAAALWDAADNATEKKDAGKKE